VYGIRYCKKDDETCGQLTVSRLFWARSTYCISLSVASLGKPLWLVSLDKQLRHKDGKSSSHEIYSRQSDLTNVTKQRKNQRQLDEAP